ncbi:Ger(x)C family spore germination protein [Paenibacillus sp. HJGM_3]|uniref:Ger(x)C family spore germination protein n=1 Tax=Paenibacillus sp. HJGM_3 TaxID=3379816 RepID=UPI00385CF31D
MRKILMLLIAVILLLPTTGCWNRRELNTLAIAVGIGIDKAGDNYEVSAQVVNPGEAAARKATGTRSPVTLYRATGSSIFEALRKMTKESPRKIYLSHVRILVIGESMAREGIGEVIDFLSRDHEFRTDFFVVVAKEEKAADLFTIMTTLEKLPSVELFNSLEMSERVWAPTIAVTLDKLLNDLTSQGKHVVLTGVRATGDKEIGKTEKNTERIEQESRLKSNGMAVFNRDKLIGWLDETESKSYNYITNHVKSTVGHIQCPDGGDLSLEVLRTHAEVSGKLVNDKPVIDVKLRVEQNVGEVKCSIDLTKPESIQQIDTLSEEKIKGMIESTINKLKKQFKVDIFGFGEAFHRAEPKAWKTLGKDWDRQFVGLQVNVSVNVKTLRIGTITNSAKKEMKK